MNARVLVLGLLLTAPPTALAVDPAPALSDSAVSLPPAVVEAFAEQGDQGPVISPELQAYFRAQPSHLQDLFTAKMGSGLIGGAAHVRTLLSLQLSGQNFEQLLSDNCVLCHSNPDNQGEETLFTHQPTGEAARAHLDLDDVVRDVHFRRGLSCSGCHGGSPDDEEMSDAIYDRWPDADTRRTDRSWIPAFCARCHSDPQFMREFDPGLPTDQLAKYKTSRHGQLMLDEHDSKAAQCVSCHGVHGIQGPKTPTSPVYPTNIPNTCGACHANAAYMAGYTVHGRPIPTTQKEQYLASVHGRALMEKHDLGAPVCNDCHGNHAANPPGVSQVALVCRNCHSAEANYFDASRHEKAFEAHGWPQCVECHGKHDIQHPTEAMLANEPGTVCFDCHTKFSADDAECSAMTTYMRDQINGLQTAVASFQADTEHLAERGLDVEPLEGTMSEISDALKGSRTRVHAFDRSTFDKTATEGRNAVEKAQTIVDQLHADYRSRTAGLLMSIGFMALLAIGIWLRLRAIERRRA